VSDLEQFLGVKLMARTTRRLHLTEAGERFYTDAKRLLEQFSHLVTEARSGAEKPTGTLRLATAVMFGRRQITPLLQPFQERYPDIVIEHYLSDAQTDLVRDGIDLAIKAGRMKDSTHQARRLGATPRVTVASPAFLARHGTPAHPSALAALPCLVFLSEELPFEWRYRDAAGGDLTIRIDGTYRADTTEALREAALAGLGLYRAPLSTVGEDILAGRLVRLLSDFEPEPIPLYAVMPNSAHVPQKTRVFIDFLRERFRQNRWISVDGDADGLDPPAA
jgi:DNA-binding transcriptional LysR family regulator